MKENQPVDHLREIREAIKRGDLLGAAEHAKHSVDATQAAEEQIKDQKAIAHSAKFAELQRQRAGTAVSPEGDVVPTDNLPK